MLPPYLSLSRSLAHSMSDGAAFDLGEYFKALSSLFVHWTGWQAGCLLGVCAAQPSAPPHGLKGSLALSPPSKEASSSLLVPH